MATEKIILTGDWQLIVLDGVDFILQNPTVAVIDVCFSDTPPAAEAAFHTIASTEGLVRMGVVGDVYARGLGENGTIGHLVVSRGV